MKDIKLHLDAEDFRPAFVLEDVEGVILDHIQLPAAYQDKPAQIVAKDSREVELRACGDLRVTSL